MPRLWPRGGLWRHHDFLLLWGAETASQFGTQVTHLALPLVAVLVLDAGAFAVALLTLFDFLPYLLLSLPAGVWVDRLPRRPILVLADLGRGLALATIPVAYVLDALSMSQLYAVGFVAGTLTVFFDVAYQAYLPALVERDQLVEGNAKLELSRSAASVGGPGIGGLLVAAVTAPYAIAVDAVSFLASSVLLFRIRRHETSPARGTQRSLRRELAEGFRYVLGDPRWRSMIGYVASSNFFLTIATSVFLVFAVRELGLSAGAIGLILTLGNIGAFAGALVAGRLSRRLGVGHTLVVGGVLSGPPFLLVPLAPADFPIPFLVAGQFCLTLGIVIYNVTAISLIQALTPERMLGRMTACRRFMVWGTIPLGALAGGALASAIGVRQAILAGTIGLSLSFLFLLLPPLRSIREMPSEPPPADA